MQTEKIGHTLLKAGWHHILESFPDFYAGKSLGPSRAPGKRKRASPRPSPAAGDEDDVELDLGSQDEVGYTLPSWIIVPLENYVSSHKSSEYWLVNMSNNIQILLL